MLLLQAATTTAQTVGSPITAYWPVMIFFAVAVIFPVLPIVLGRFLRPIKYEKSKMRPYECGIDPTTGQFYDDTRRYIDNSALSAGDKQRIFEENAYRVYPRLKARLG